MTPEEVLRGLRDIQLPEAVDAAPAGLAAEPFLVLAAILAGVALARRWRGRRWRGEARARLAEIAREPDPARRWQRLVALAARLAPLTGHRPLPAAAYLPPHRVGADEAAALDAHLRALLGR